MAFPPKSYMHSSSPPHACYMPCPLHPPRLDNSNYTWRRVQVMELIIMQFRVTDTRVFQYSQGRIELWHFTCKNATRTVSDMTLNVLYSIRDQIGKEVGDYVTQQGFIQVTFCSGIKKVRNPPPTPDIYLPASVLRDHWYLVPSFWFISPPFL
jgi:hypothetical protein